jgi:putative thioredoxin
MSVAGPFAFEEVPMSEAATAWVFDVSEADFERAVVQASRSKPVLVDFWAPWCGPCQMLGPLLERLVAERQGEVLLAKLNVDEAPTLAGRYEVSSIPAVKAFRDGRVWREFVGLLPEEHLHAFLDEVVPSAAERLAAQAASLEATDLAAAERLYREAVEKDRNALGARVGLARVLLAQGKTDEVEAILEPVGSEGEAGAEAERLLARLHLRRLAGEVGDEAAARRRLAAEPESARRHFELGCVLAAKGDLAGALPELLAAAERDPKLASGPAREAMVQVFYLLGVDHPLANEYRAKLARLLY